VKFLGIGTGKVMRSRPVAFPNRDAKIELGVSRSTGFPQPRQKSFAERA
jgi:hypothetical protein